MKKTLLTIALAAATAAAFAQGKVSLQNDGSSLYTLSSTPGSVLVQDTALAGHAIPITGPLPSGVVLEVGLFGGASDTMSTMTLQGEAILNPTGGGAGPSAGQAPFTHIVTSLPGGTPAYFYVAVWNSAYATPELAAAAGGAGMGYVGYNNVFSMTPGSSISYPPITGGGGSTWVAAGDETPLLIGIVPEPSTLALAGLGAAALMIFRRRK